MKAMIMGHAHFVPQNTVFFDVRTRGERRRGQEEGIARVYIYIYNTYVRMYVCTYVGMYVRTYVGR